MTWGLRIDTLRGARSRSRGGHAKTPSKTPNRRRMRLRPTLGATCVPILIGLLACDPVSEQGDAPEVEEAAPRKNRNVVVVMFDDLGKESLSLYGSAPGQDPTRMQARTPSLDALAAGGVTFRNFYTNPACTPSRAQFLTGLPAFESGYGTNRVVAPLDVRHPTIASVFRDAHYGTAHRGKWHIDGSARSSTCHPHQMGFDTTIGKKGRGKSYSDWPLAIECALQEDNETTYLPTYVIDSALDYVREKESVGESYFLFVALKTPHAPWEYPPHGLLEEPDPSIPAGTRSSARLGDTGDTTAETAARVALYNSIIEAGDTELGRLIAELDLSRTTVVVVSDNGTAGAAIDERFFDPNRGKGKHYELGVNVPLIITGPDVHPSLRGSTSDALVQMSDLFATLVDIEQLDTPFVPMSSKSIKYALTGAQPPSDARSIVSVSIFRPYGFDSADRHLTGSMARNDRYSLVLHVRQSGGVEMYDLVADPNQKKNLADGSLTDEEQAAWDRLAPHLSVEVRDTPCSNGLDDDGDGLVDAADPGCIGDLDLSERGFDRGCDDGYDEDRDGFVDYPYDPDCLAPQDATEFAE